MNKGFLNFVAVASFIASMACIVMTFLFAVVGLQVYIPVIPIGSYNLHIDFIQLGMVIAGLYLFWQGLQALTPLADPWAESLAWVGSKLALGGFVLIFFLMLVQKSMDVGNIAELVRTSYPFQLIVVLMGVALIDITFLQWLKHKLYGSHETIQGEVLDRNDVVLRQMTHGQSLVNPGVPLVGRIDRATINYFNCAGKDIEVIPSSTEGGDPTVRVITPRAA